MKRKLMAIAAAAATIPVLAAAPALASTAHYSPGRPAITQAFGGCRTGYTCFYGDETGSEGPDMPIAQNSRWNGHWYLFLDNLSYFRNPGSLYEDGGSSVYVYDSSTQGWLCFSAGQQGYYLGRAYDYFYIKYGIPGCHGLPGGGP